MKLVISLVLFLAFFVILPRPAAACDPNCGQWARVGATVYIGLPASLLTITMVPGLATLVIQPAEDEFVPSYGTTLIYTVLGTVAGLGLAYGTHQLFYPEGPSRHVGATVAWFALPPLLVGAGAAALVHRPRKRAGAMGMVPYIVPGSDGLSVGVGAWF